jgi:hypothetical protein
MRLKREANAMESESFSNRDWQITRTKDGNVPDAQVTHALLTDVRGELKGIRELLTSIRRILVFFVVVTVAGLVIGVLAALSHS